MDETTDFEIKLEREPKTLTLLADTVPEPKSIIRAIGERLGLAKPHNKRIWKGEDGYRRMLIITSNAYEDREGETITTKALSEWVDRQWLDNHYVGDNPLLFWHDTRVKMGDIIFSDISGSFLVEVAKEDDSPLSPYIWDYAETVDNAGASHRFVAIPTLQDETVFEWIDKEETTWLPREAAANELTYAGVLPVERKEFFDKMLGMPDASKLLDKGIEELMSALNAKGIKHKSQKQTSDQARLSLEIIKEMATMPETSAEKLDRLMALYEKSIAVKAEGDMPMPAEMEATDAQTAEDDAYAMLDERLARIEEAIATLLNAKMTADEQAAADAEAQAQMATAKALKPRIAKRASQSVDTIIDLDDAPAGIKSFGQPTEDFFGHKIAKRGY